MAEESGSNGALDVLGVEQNMPTPGIATPLLRCDMLCGAAPAPLHLLLRVRRSLLQLVSVLKAQALQGCTVVASIHQPAERLLALFDRLLCLLDGRLAYLGPSGETLLK